MSQSTATLQASVPAEVPQANSASRSAGREKEKKKEERKDNELCVIFDHARRTIEEISELASDKSGYSVAWLLLEFIKKGRCRFPLGSLDLSGFSLSASKLKLLLSSLPSGPGFLETLKCGPGVCKETCIPVLLDFLLRLKAGGTGEGRSICLKNLNLAGCDLGGEAGPVFSLLPRSVECLDLSANRLRTPSVEGLASVLWSGWLQKILSLDLSDNPLGPSGLRALAKGLSSTPQSLSLQSLKLARTKARAEGMEALAEALKAKKTTSLQTLDLAENEMRPAGLKHLASAVNAEAVPRLIVLILKKNFLSHVTARERDYTPATELLSTSSLKKLEELDLSENGLFDQVMEGGGGGEGGAVPLSAAAIAVPGRFPKLRRLDLGKGELETYDEGMCMSSLQLAAFAIAFLVEGAPSLEELEIPDGDLEEPPVGVFALSIAISAGRLAKLKGFKMCGRREMTGEAFATLGRSLATGNTSLLQTLDLEMCRENPEEAVEAIAEAIRGGGLGSLTSLSLNTFNEFLSGGPSLSSLGRALGGGGCSRLQKLHLVWNEEGDEGVGGIAEGLGGGGLWSLRDLSLNVACVEEHWEEGEGEGCVALGEVLSTSKVPSLHSVCLHWKGNQSFRSLCKGFSRGSIAPPVLLDIYFLLAEEGEASVGVTRFAEVVREGKLSGLRKVSVEHGQLSRADGAALGEALTHSQAALNCLEEIYMKDQTPDGTAAFLSGLSRGPGSLPALQSLKFDNFYPNGIQSAQSLSAQSLSALVNGGKVPSLKDLRVNLWEVGQEGMQPLSAALSSPHVSALRHLSVSFWGVAPANAAAEVGILSVALSSGCLRGLE